MYQIGICDDDKFICTELEEMLEKFAAEQEIKVKISVWYSGETLCEHFKRGNNIDYLFLDIELGTSNGVDVGKFIREEIENYLMEIIFISFRQDYAIQLFKVKPMDFLIKPINQEQVNEVILRCINKKRSKNSFFEFQYDRCIYRLAYDEIIYFKSDDKKIQIFTQKQIYTYYDKLKNIVEIVKERFIWIHKSYLINPLYVYKFSRDLVVMINGDVLSISKAHRKEVNQILLESEGEY